MANGDSPFSPGKPVTPELFVGRELEIRRLQARLRKCSHGSVESIFLMGDRGIGKSSLAKYAGYYSELEKSIGLAPVFCQLTAAADLDVALQIISREILQKFSRETIPQKLRNLFDRYIETINLGLLPGIGLKIAFKKDAATLRSLRLDFSDLLLATIEITKDKANGLILVLDDLNGVAKDPDLANFIKGLIDGLVMGGHGDLPFSLVLIGVSERLDEMLEHQPSVGRIFDVIALQKLHNEEASSFFYSAFERVGISVEEDALKIMTMMSGGMPAIMHEIGDAVFWQHSGKTVNEHEAWAGCFQAADNIGRKYLEPRVFEKMKSESYRTILDKIAEFNKHKISRKWLLKVLDTGDERKLDNFFKKMVNAGVLSKKEIPGEYYFTREIYGLYNILRHHRRIK